MQHIELIKTLSESPSVRLLKMRSLEFFLGFVVDAFENQVIGQERLYMLLESRLDQLTDDIIDDAPNMEEFGESNDAKAKRLIKEWTGKGFLTNYQNEEGEILYELSSHTSKVIDWVETLKKEDYIGTESKFKILLKTNYRMSEKLSHIIRQNEQSNVEATKQIIKDIKKLLIDASQNKEKSAATLSYEDVEINLPLERQLTLTPTKEVEFKDKPQDAVLSIDDLEQIGKLYNPYHVDRRVLRSRIDSMLKDHGQTTIAEVVACSGVEKGLSELFGYIGILKEYKTAVLTERTQCIAFSEDKSIEIPEIIITR